MVETRFTSIWSGPKVTVLNLLPFKTTVLNFTGMTSLLGGAQFK
jgi:hypothetical protein